MRAAVSSLPSLNFSTSFRSSFSASVQFFCSQVPIQSKKVSASGKSSRSKTQELDAERGQYTIIKDADDPKLGMYDRPLPCFGCGIGWFSFLLGFGFPLMWYYATVLYFGNYYHRDPRERAGLAASAIAALICTIALLITLLATLL